MSDYRDTKYEGISELVKGICRHLLINTTYKFIVGGWVYEVVKGEKRGHCS